MTLVGLHLALNSDWTLGVLRRSRPEAAGHCGKGVRVLIAPVGGNEGPAGVYASTRQGLAARALLAASGAPFSLSVRPTRLSTALMVCAPFRLAVFGGLVVPGKAVEHSQDSRDKYNEHGR